MRRKTIKKPKFIKIFCLWLAVLWVITGACSFFMYRLTDSKLEKMYEEEMDGYIATLEGLCNNYYEACRDYAWDEDNSGEDDVAGCCNELLYNMHLIAANTGMYSEYHMYDVKQTVKYRYECGDINESEKNEKIEWFQTVNVGYASSEFMDGSVAYFVCPSFAFKFPYCFRSPISMSEVLFYCDGETMKIGSENKLDAEDREIKEQKNRIKEINDDFGITIWNYLDTAYSPDNLKCAIFKTYPIEKILYNCPELKFVPYTLYDRDDPKKVWRAENIEATYMYSGLMCIQYEHIKENTMYVIYEPSDLLTSDDINLISDGKTREYYDEPDEIETALSSDDEFGESSWTLRVAKPEYKSLIKTAPKIVIYNVATWFAVMMVIALVVSYIQYLRHKLVYELVEYRRRVTDSMAHDLKTPLAAISAYSENLEESSDSEKRAYYTSQIRDNIASMNGMIEGILDFSKGESATLKATISEIDVCDVVEGEYASLKSIFEKNDLKVNIKGSGVKVKTDEKLLRQALKNLLGNAVKFSRKGTNVDINITDSDLTVSNLTDEKIGNIKDIKKPFVKGDESRDDKSGSGLGLAIAESSLEAAGHKLKIDKENDTFKAVIKW